MSTVNGMMPDKLSLVQRIGRGRGINTGSFTPGQCLCKRPYCHVLCNVCGYLAWGRVRYSCPTHPQTVFLIDITQCPRCRSFEFMLTEF